LLQHTFVVLYMRLSTSQCSSFNPLLYSKKPIHSLLAYLFPTFAFVTKGESSSALSKLTAQWTTSAHGYPSLSLPASPASHKWLRLRPLLPSNGRPKQLHPRRVLCVASPPYTSTFAPLRQNWGLLPKQQDHERPAKLFRYRVSRQRDMSTTSKDIVHNVEKSFLHPLSAMPINLASAFADRLDDCTVSNSAQGLEDSPAKPSDRFDRFDQRSWTIIIRGHHTTASHSALSTLSSVSLDD